MLFSKLIFSTFAIAGTTQAFAPTQHKSFIATNAIRDEKTQIYSYLDSLASASPLDFSSVNPQQQDASSNPSTFGQMISGGIDDISALDAASSEMRAVVARTGSISAAEISNLLDKSNNVRYNYYFDRTPYSVDSFNSVSCLFFLVLVLILIPLLFRSSPSSGTTFLEQ